MEKIKTTLKFALKVTVAFVIINAVLDGINIATGNTTGSDFIKYPVSWLRSKFGKNQG